ncbi:MAG: DUF2155 domain-containing protein [Geminicoccaceae bacterium]|nr:DUF2155 domain-containing protein [Geminicoccaceae bacterium]MCX8101825.1 DUF2155 domain-containing protein [Geminicoccaceae bacterium]MDW8370717.1 DUF2155 domain-containing protein [Geminicoccaceae bacterium]
MRKPAGLSILLALLLLPAATAWSRPSEPHRIAVLRTLDKVTARVGTIEAPIDTATRFGTLRVTPRACLVAPPIEPPERAAFLEIREQDGPQRGEVVRFQGWMFASSPGLSALEHPVYDVWLLDCREPLAAPSSATSR